MGTTFTYALILAICQIVFSLVMYFLGFQTDKLAVGQYLNWIGAVISIVVLWFGIRAVREETPDKSLSYGRGVGAGVLISLYSGLMSAVYNYIHFKFINPSFFDYQLELMKQKWAAQGLSDDKIERGAAMMQRFSGPGVSAVVTPFIAVLFGLVISLILAAMLKRAAPAPAAPPMAA